MSDICRILIPSRENLLEDYIEYVFEYLTANSDYYKKRKTSG
jgi:hypothetical protein